MSTRKHPGCVSGTGTASRPRSHALPLPPQNVGLTDMAPQDGRAEARLAALLLRGSAKSWAELRGIEEKIWRKEMSRDSSGTLMARQRQLTVESLRLSGHWAGNAAPGRLLSVFGGRGEADRSSVFCPKFRRFFPFWSHHPPKCHNRSGFWSCGACRLCQTQDAPFESLLTSMSHWLPSLAAVAPTAIHRHEKGRQGGSRARGPVTTCKLQGTNAVVMSGIPIRCRAGDSRPTALQSQTGPPLT